MTDLDSRTRATDPITIYHLGASQSERIVWLMEELDLPYRLEWYDRGADYLAPPEYLALHPASMAPVIRDGDLVLAESTAIVQYIAHRHGGGKLTVGPDDDNYADYLYWLEFNNNFLCTFFMKRALEEGGSTQAGGNMTKIANRRADGLLRQMNEHLSDNAYLAGDDFSLADLMSGYVVTSLPALLRHEPRESIANVLAFAERLRSRPAWKKAMAIAGRGAKRPE